MPDALFQAANQVWPAFVLVIGLLLIGSVVEQDGLFEACGARIERVRGGPFALLGAVLAFDAIVTALLNLDTAAVFVTPIAIHAATRRGCDVRPFLYGALFMANGASLLLPGSNLTNVIVLSHERISGLEFAHRMALAWVAVVLVTVAFVWLVYRPAPPEAVRDEPLPELRLGLGALLTALATLLILALHNAALPVLAIGIAGVAVRRLRPEVAPAVLGGLFALAVALGAVGRLWRGPADLLARHGAVASAIIGAAGGDLVNNLPAASLLAARPPTHPLELLVGLNLGPNLLFTGSLSSYLWYRAAKKAGAQPSLRTSSLLGCGLVPLTLAVALAALGWSP